MVKSITEQDDGVFFLSKHLVDEEDDILSCTKIISTAVSLFKKLFEQRQPSSKDKQLKHILRTWAWIIFCIYTVGTLLMWGTGKAVWLGENRSCFNQLDSESVNTKESYENCVPMEFREELVDNIRPTIRYIVMISIVCAVILNIIVFKWRKLADMILYFNQVQFLIISISSANQTNLTDFYIAILHLMPFLVFWTDTVK